MYEAGSTTNIAGDVESALIALLATLIAGVLLARGLRRAELMWTWAAVPLPIAALLLGAHRLIALGLTGCCLLACRCGARWHREDLQSGADLAEQAGMRVGLVTVLERIASSLQLRRRGWLEDAALRIGSDRQRLPVLIPVGYQSGSHTLLLGATGSGKTVTETWIASRLIEAGHGAIAIDPKGDRLLRSELARAAAQRGVPFLEWTPAGPLAYNPYAHGSESEIADKALAAEAFTEPHYLRQAQRYLAHAVRAMRGAQVPVSCASLAAHLDPRELEACVRRLPEAQARETQGYLDSLGERQRRELSGVRDRLSILAESDVRRWLEPSEQTQALDLRAALAERAVVYMCLDADRRMLLSQVLAGAVVSDLVTLVAERQENPLATVVLIDEFQAVAAAQVARLFGRARSAGVSLILAAQELADVKGAGEGLRDQVLGNVATVIAHRQSVPESAELIADVAGRRPAWVSTQQTRTGLFTSLLSGRGSRRREHQHVIDPGQIKCLAPGWSAVITPGWRQAPTIAQIHHPYEAHG